jgi:hypothetical protein
MLTINTTVQVKRNSKKKKIKKQNITLQF